MSQFEDRGFQGAGLGLAMVLGSTLVSGALAGAREAGEQAADSFTAYQWSLACEALEAKAEEIGTLMEAKSQILMQELHAQGLSKATGLKARIGVAESIVPQVEDWDRFYAFIRKNNAFELLERRPAAAAYRERAGSRKDKTVPGVVPFVKRKLSLTVNT